MNFAPFAVLCRVVSRYVPVEDKAFPKLPANHCLPEAAKRAVELSWRRFQRAAGCCAFHLLDRSLSLTRSKEAFLDKVDAKARSRRAHEMKSCRSPTRIVLQHFITPYQTSESIMRCMCSPRTTNYNNCLRWSFDPKPTTIFSFSGCGGTAGCRQ